MALRIAAALAALDAFSVAGAAGTVDDFSMRVGGFMTRFDTTITYGARPGEPGNSIDFDRELGLEDRKLIESFAFSWRAWPRHEFGIDYFSEELTGTRKLEHEIELDEETFPLATTVQSSFTLKALEFHYTWWTILQDRWAIGPRIGYVNYRMGTSIEMLLGEEGEPPEVGVEASWSDGVPSLTFGVDFRFIPAERWRVSANAGWFQANFRTVSPVIATARVGVEYFPWESFGFWTDFGMSHIDADIHSSSFDGDVEIYEGGLRFGVTWRM